MSAPYVPERGDAVWLTFAPVAGHERDGRRPALALGPSAYNGRTGLVLARPGLEGCQQEARLRAAATAGVPRHHVRNRLHGAPRHADDPFAPATQVVLLDLLLTDLDRGHEPDTIARRPGDSPTSISHAARALERANLVDLPKDGRTRYLRLRGAPKDVWEAGTVAARVPRPRTLRSSTAGIRRCPRCG